MNQMIGRNTMNAGQSGYLLQGSPRNLEPFSLGNHISGQ
jgi:CHASE3 domain sensor protein